MIELYLSLWRGSIGFHLCRESWERAAFTWLLLHIRWGKHESSLEVYRTQLSRRDRRGLSFHINLPLLKIANDIMQKVVTFEDEDRIVSVVTGKVLWKTLKQLEVA